MTMPPEQESELLQEVTELLEQHPIKQVLGSWLSPHEVHLAEESALRAVLRATPGDPQADEYYLSRREDGSHHHLMGS
ncbi:hypothetical protein [Streptomyces noursei]|nr:hypothetical protein [Streptomyces noursei]